MKKFIVLILMANLAFAGKYFYEKKSSQSQNTLIKPLPEIKKEDFSMLKNRDEIAQQYKWDLNDIYPNWNQWEADLVKLKELMTEIPKYQGEISKNPKTFVEFINLEEKISRLLDKIYLYPYLQRDLDSTNEMASVKLQEIESIYANYSISSSWITPEILTIPKETMITWINDNPCHQCILFS